jgi:hypothetical protein
MAQRGGHRRLRELGGKASALAPPTPITAAPASGGTIGDSSSRAVRVTFIDGGHTEVSVSLVLWWVANSIGAEGLPVEDWAHAARAQLLAHRAVRTANVCPSYEEDEIAPSGTLAGLLVDVTVEHEDPSAAARLVERAVTAGLFDVVGDSEVGWTAYDWEARPAATAG